MTPDTLAAALEWALPPGTAVSRPGGDAWPALLVEPPSLLEFARVLRDHPDLKFTLLAELTAVDFSPREPRFAVVYLLVAPDLRHRLQMKVIVPGHDPRLPTVTGIWPAANWLEREVWDLFGIAFDGHPDPRRLLMPDDWEGFPLRKDYPVQIDRRVGTAEPMQVTPEEFQANLQRDRLDRTRTPPH
jgi:NADH-quinone oxidoreductase subunit C